MLSSLLTYWRLWHNLAQIHWNEQNFCTLNDQYCGWRSSGSGNDLVPVSDESLSEPIGRVTHSWWRHQTETFSTLLALCVGNPLFTCEFPSKRPVTRSFDVFFDLCLNKWLSKQSRRRWFEMPLRSLWRHCNVMGLLSWFPNFNSLRPSDAFMRQLFHHHWFR